ncbi:LINE-1 retrotransposable element ORF2 protein [Vitis vinifera]|uniref:LINE-1 retrotransposable element ORF2 protein n=1 Tax=Vitis vinifera TaxID=29760 RepID=A0A438BW69_VITVI|nr:LINE-1 retrotransposable element ORF2 protein [Vitis vinifera]
MDHLSHPASREKGLNFEGYCGMTEMEILEVSSHHFSQSYLPFHSPFSGAAPPHPSSSAIDLSILAFQSYIGFVGIPNRDDAVPQLSRLNLLSESCNYVKTNPSSHHGAPILGIASQGDTEFSQMGVFKAKEQSRHRHLSSVDVESGCSDVTGNKREVCDRRFVGSVRSVRNKEWAALSACGASGGILIIWDSKKMSSEDVEGFFGGAIRPFGLTFPSWCVGGDFNVIRRSSEKLGGSRFTSSMRDFDGFIRESELHDPPLRNASFTWSNMQESPVCKRLDWFLYSNEWELSFPQSLQDVLPRWTSIIGRLYWIPILSSGVQHLLGLRICGCNIIVSKSALAVGGENLKEMVGKERKKTILDEIAIIDANEQEGALSSDLAVQRALDRDKASGPDGFTIAVFQDCWDVIKDDLVRVFAEFHNCGIINQNTNASFIVLLPKKSRSKKISDFRPISLITCLYKIDFEKAYDHVKWDFLDHVLEKKGFSPKWRKWMRGCLSSVSYAILVNGNAKGWVKASRGLRQGDPLSHFLFTIVADVLSRMLLKAEERSLLEGFRVGRNRCMVSHLQFPDDTIFFANSSEEELQTLKSLLLVFGQVSGLKVKLDKSFRLAILYLGLPLGGNPTTCGFWDPVIERISRRLDGWQKAYLSFGVAAKVERMQMNFLWSGVGEGKRDHLVSWDAV